MLIGVMDIVFTFGGQVNWMRYIISMRTPSKFPLAVAAVSGVMTTAYVAIGSIGCALAPCTPAPAHVGHVLLGARGRLQRRVQLVCELPNRPAYGI